MGAMKHAWACGIDVEAEPVESIIQRVKLCGVYLFLHQDQLYSHPDKMPTPLLGAIQLRAQDIIEYLESKPYHDA